MSEEIGNEELEVCEKNNNWDIYTAIECFKIRFLQNKKSIFTDNEILVPSKKVWVIQKQL